MTNTDDRPRTTADATEDEAELVRRIAAADQTAFETLYDRFSAMAFAVALRITADAALAEDLVHDSFLLAWRNAGSFDASRGSLKTWFLSIVHHRAIDEVRKRHPVEALPEAEQIAPAALTVPDVWSEVAGRLDRETVGRALATLSPVQRETIELSFYGGLTQEEIAKQTGVPLGTVKGRMRLALQTLRRLLIREAPVEPSREPEGAGR